MSNKLDKDKYLERKPFSVETTKEQMIYGGGETLQEVKDKTEKESKLILNEG